MLNKEMAESESQDGTRGEQVLAVQEHLFRQYADPKLCEKPSELEKRGGAYYSTVAAKIMKALLGQDSINMPVNYRNQGALSDLPEESVVETNCIIDQNGVRPLAWGKLPDAVRGLICQVKMYETLTVEASVEHSRQKAVLALLNHPLVHGYDNAVKLVDEMIGHFGEYIGELV